MEASPLTRCSTTEQVTQVLIRSLAAGKTVEIDGLGVFYPDPVQGFRFEPLSFPQVFIAYVKEDYDTAARLYETLETAGFSPWMDVRKLLPGQNWPRAIENAIEMSDFFIACFSTQSVHKKGGFQAEIRYALECARQIPLDDTFIIPVRFNDCRVPHAIQRELQYIDLSPDWPRGIRRLIGAMRRQLARRNERLKT
jgi:hypothetical protein